MSDLLRRHQAMLDAWYASRLHEAEKRISQLVAKRAILKRTVEIAAQAKAEAESA